MDDHKTFTFEYLPWRGVSRETYKLFGVRTKVDASGKPVALGFTYPSGATKVRSLEDKKFWWEGEHKPGLFGLDKFAAGSHKYVAITEGELDACSLHQAIQIPVVSVQSASSASADVAADRSYLSSFERIYLAFDGDAAGRDATAIVARQFDYNKVFHIRFTRPDRKDANSFVELGEREDLLNIYLNAKRYLPDTVVSALSDFKKILEEPHPPSVPYPFPSLNQMTYGIRTGEIVLITAQEGIGKTELMHTLEHNLLKETSNAVAAIYLEEPRKRHLQALAGISLRRPVHLPDNNCSQDQIVAAVDQLVQRDDRLYLYSHYGSDDPDVLLDTIRYLVTACNVRCVLLDHISMAVSALSELDERRTLDYICTRLEMMVNELDFALIIVSHVNDEGKTRGSRYISKVATIRIDLDRDFLSPDPVTRNTTSMVISKNRFCGRTGPAGTYVFDPVTYTLNQERSFSDVETDQGREDSQVQPEEKMETTTEVA